MLSDDYVLVTGASGFIGQALVARLATTCGVICLSRRALPDPPAGSIVVQGEFHSFEDLRRLDAYRITSTVHLAAVTGGSTEEDALSVNVLGTRRLLRYLVDRGCRQFVLASSIAAVGSLDPDFIPLSVPIPDEHPCLARDAYGLSKAMMEDVTRYLHRVHPDTSFIHLRLGSVLGDAANVPQFSVDAPPQLPFVELARVMLSDVVHAFEQAVRADLRSGVHVYNVVGPDIPCRDNIADVLRACLGTRIVDRIESGVSDQVQDFGPLYSMNKIRQDLKFVSNHTTRI